MWLSDMISKANNFIDLEGANNTPPKFSISSISKVPYIDYPNLNKNERLEIQEQAKEILRKSYTTNKCDEMAVLYNLDATNEKGDKYIYIKGNAEAVSVLKDERAEALLKKIEDENCNNMVIICIHNHPNLSEFSITDMLFFANHPSIKIMEVVNSNGEIAFMSRPEYKVYPIVAQNIINAEPNIKKIIADFEKNNPDKEIRISDIITNKEVRQDVLRLSRDGLISEGVVISNYINQEQANQIDYSIFKQSGTNNNSHHPNILPINNLNTSSLENGEDSYEWEYS